jgi:hypothetical protein
MRIKKGEDRGIESGVTIERSPLDTDATFNRAVSSWRQGSVANSSSGPIMLEAVKEKETVEQGS